MLRQFTPFLKLFIMMLNHADEYMLIKCYFWSINAHYFQKFVSDSFVVCKMRFCLVCVSIIQTENVRKRIYKCDLDS